jgi:hypothetical protein
MSCKKVIHEPGKTGYLHEADDDRPYDVDGVEYCGRCHGLYSFGHGSELPVSEIWTVFHQLWAAWHDGIAYSQEIKDKWGRLQFLLHKLEDETPAMAMSAPPTTEQAHWYRRGFFEGSDAGLKLAQQYAAMLPPAPIIIPKEALPGFLKERMEPTKESRMWRLECKYTEGPNSNCCLQCQYITNDLVKMQEHAMDQHGASKDDVRSVEKRALGTDHYRYTSRNGLVDFEASR